MSIPHPYGISAAAGPELLSRLEYQQQRPGHQFFVNQVPQGVPIQHNMSPERNTPDRAAQGSPGSIMFSSPSMQNFQRFQSEPQDSGGFASWTSMKFPDQQ